MKFVSDRNVGLSRRDFLSRATLAASTIAVSSSGALSAFASELTACPIVVFSKVYQEIKLGFDEAADLTAEAGLQGIDCPVRRGGEILPEHAADEIPRYAEALRRRKLQLPLLTTDIDRASTRAEQVLRAARKEGVLFYRLAVDKPKDVPADKHMREVRARLKDLAALNREIGVGGLLQNHSSTRQGQSYFGGDLTEMRAAVEGFEPTQIGVAFDIGHALVTHGDEWRQHFEKLRPHVRIAYVKDVTRAGKWVAFGRGDIAATGFFKRLKELDYRAPFSLHIEYNWSDYGKARTRPVLLKTLQDSVSALRGWLKQ